MIALAVGTGRSFTNLTDFDARATTASSSTSPASARTPPAPTSSTAATAPWAARRELLQGRRRGLQRRVGDGPDRQGLRHRRQGRTRGQERGAGRLRHLLQHHGQRRQPALRRPRSPSPTPRTRSPVSPTSIHWPTCKRPTSPPTTSSSAEARSNAAPGFPDAAQTTPASRGPESPGLPQEDQRHPHQRQRRARPRCGGGALAGPEPRAAAGSAPGEVTDIVETMPTFPPASA